MYWESDTSVFIHLPMQYIEIHIQLRHKTFEMLCVPLNVHNLYSNNQDQWTRVRKVVIYIPDILVWQRFLYHFAFVRKIHAPSPDYQETGQ